MERLHTSRRVYELYRTIDMDWAGFQTWAQEQGWALRSPHQVLQAAEANELLKSFIFVPPSDESEMMVRLREALGALPDEQAHATAIRLLYSIPQGDERALALDYAEGHILEHFARFPPQTLFDWEHVEAKESFWTAILV